MTFFFVTHKMVCLMCLFLGLAVEGDGSIQEDIRMRRLSTEDTLFQALSQLYLQTEGSSWKVKNNWMNGTSPCLDGWSWYGVTCSSNDTSIEALHLMRNNISGIIPSQLGLLGDSISSMELQSNQLRGFIPSELGLLSSLDIYFDLSYNSLSGALPSQLAHLSSLTKTFSVKSNYLVQSISSELGSFTAVSSFLLSSNQFTGTIPSQLGRLSFVSKKFELGLNSLSGTIPTQLGSLSKVTHDFSLHSNLLTGPIPTELGLLLQLTNSFKVNDNSFCGSIPSEVSALSSLMVEFAITSGNSMLGTDCCLFNMSSTYTCPPTPLPTSSPSEFLNGSCIAGQYFINNQCMDCEAGRFSNDDSTECSLCPAGKYNSQSAQSACINCEFGEYSSSDGTSCGECTAGEHIYNETECVKCEFGKFAPWPLGDSCLECPGGFHTNNYTGATECTSCEAGKYSNDSSLFCHDCAVGQYSLERARECVSCPIGRFASNVGCDSCKACPGGRYTSHNGSFNCTSCSKGTYQLSEGQSHCLNCEIGKYAMNTGSSVCSECSVGKIASSESAITCDGCQPGKYQLFTGQYECLNCARGLYVNSTGAVYCLECPYSYSSIPGSSSCTRAAAGFFIDYKGRSQECLHHCTCKGGLNSPIPHEGYWLDRSNYRFANHAYRCPRDTCMGSDDNSTCWKISHYTSKNCDNDKLLCSKGARGPLCGSCTYGYVFQQTTNTCVHCDDSSNLNLMFVFIAIIVGIVVVLVVTFQYRLHSCNIIDIIMNVERGSLKVIWVTYQIIVSTSFTLDIRFPPPFSHMLEFLSVFSFDFLSVECLLPGDDAYYSNEIAWSLAPILLSILSLLVFGVRYFFMQRKISATHHEESSKQIIDKERTSMFNQHIWFFLFLSYLVLPPVANKHLQVFDCIELNSGKRYLRKETSIDCESTEYYTFRSIIIAFMCLYQLIPLIWFLVLYENRHLLNPEIPASVNAEEQAQEIRNENKSLIPIRFLFYDYKCNKWWFEIADMYRRIIFIGVLPLVSPRPSVRASFGCILSIFSVAYFREEQPYRVEFTNVIAHIAQFAVLVTYYAALSIETDSMINFGLDGYKLGIFLILFNLMIFGLVVYLALVRYKEEKTKKSWRQALDPQQLQIVNKIMGDLNLSSKSANSSNDIRSSRKRKFFDHLRKLHLLKQASNPREDSASGDVELGSTTNTGLSEGSTKSHSSRLSHYSEDASMRQLSQFILKPRDIVMLKKVGAGAFGEVFKGTCMGEPVAIKTMIDVTEQNVIEFRYEILLTASLRHPNIVNFIGACWGRELTCLVLEWVAKGSLRDLLENPNTDLKWEEPLLRLACDMARGMRYLHNRSYFDETTRESKTCILHRDLKPDNALVSDFIAAKLADFGTSRAKEMEDVTMTAVGTPLYVAPEISRGEMYDEKVDVYSFGLVLLEMCVDVSLLNFIGVRFMIEFNKKKVPAQPMRLIRPMTEDAWRPVTMEKPIPWAPPSINKLIVQCCDHDPAKRPSFNEIFEELSNGNCKKEIESNSYGRNEKSTMVITHKSKNDDDRKEAILLLEATTESCSPRHRTFVDQPPRSRLLKNLKSFGDKAMSAITPRSFEASSNRPGAKMSFDTYISRQLSKADITPASTEQSTTPVSHPPSTRLTKEALEQNNMVFSQQEQQEAPYIVSQPSQSVGSTLKGQGSFKTSNKKRSRAIQFQTDDDANQETVVKQGTIEEPTLEGVIEESKKEGVEHTDTIQPIVKPPGDKGLDMPRKALNARRASSFSAGNSPRLKSVVRPPRKLQSVKEYRTTSIEDV